MKLYKAIGLDIDNKSVISIVGGGGKTTFIKTLANELIEEGKRVLISTSTGIFVPPKNCYNDLFIEKIPSSFKPQIGTITYYAETNDGIKLWTKSVLPIEELIEGNLFDFVLIEADGSKGKPIKAPSSHEPVIIKYTTITIGVVGLDSIDKLVNEENVHRPDWFIKLIGYRIKVVDTSSVIKLVLNKNGIFKNCIGKKVLLLNKADNNSRIEYGREIRKGLIHTDISVVIGDIISESYIK